MRIVFITRFDFLTDKKDGGLLASSRNYEVLCELYGKNNVSLCILTPYKKVSSETVEYIQVDGNLVATYLHYIMLKDRISVRSKHQILRHIINLQPNFIFYDGSTFGQIIKSRKIKEIKNIVFFHNIERQYTWEQVKNYSKLCIFRYFATRVNEKKMVRHADKIACLNKRDADLLAKFYKKTADMIWPVTFRDTYEESQSVQEIEDIDLLYIGSYYAHNYTGLIWFIENVMPCVNRTLTIIGKNMEKLQDKIGNRDRVNIIGTVEDLGPYYKAASAMVMPIFMGGGMKVKTAEALMYGKTIFASTESLQGYDVEGIEYIYRCDTKEEFTKEINEYYESSNLRKCNESVRRLFLAEYCTETFGEKVKEYLKGFGMNEGNSWDVSKGMHT